MTTKRDLQSRAQTRMQWVLAIVILPVMFYQWIVIPAMLFFEQPGNNPNADEIRLTGRFVALMWPWGWLIATAKWRPVYLWKDQEMPTYVHTRLNTCQFYTWGCLMCLFHIALAFHVGFEWSHQKAFEHTEKASGVGEGIYFNYLFALIWTLDVLWAWIALDQYLNRPAWISVLIHGFMGFVVFNAAVVFGSGMYRWFSLIWMAIPAGGMIGMWWWNSRNRARTIAKRTDIASSDGHTDESQDYNDPPSNPSDQANR